MSRRPLSTYKVSDKQGSFFHISRQATSFTALTFATLAEAAEFVSQLTIPFQALQQLNLTPATERLQQPINDHFNPGVFRQGNDPRNQYKQVHRIGVNTYQLFTLQASLAKQLFQRHLFAYLQKQIDLETSLKQANVKKPGKYTIEITHKNQRTPATAIKFYNEKSAEAFIKNLNQPASYWQAISNTQATDYQGQSVASMLVEGKINVYEKVKVEPLSQTSYVSAKRSSETKKSLNRNIKAPILAPTAINYEAASQALTLKQAAQNGSPFCEECAS